jgi:phosphoribosylformylglycinamidine cyclo-ligase
VFELVARLGPVPREDLERTLNLGVGMVAVLDPARADEAVRLLAAAGVPSWTLGEVTAHDSLAEGSARLVGKHPG